MSFSKFKFLDLEKNEESDFEVGHYPLGCNVEKLPFNNNEKFKVSSDIDIELNGDLYDKKQIITFRGNSNEVTGVSGYIGFSGVSGYTGTSGYSGVSGMLGASGISGVSGYYDNSSLLRRFLQTISVSEIPRLNFVKAITLDTVRYSSQSVDCQVREYVNNIGTVFFTHHIDISFETMHTQTQAFVDAQDQSRLQLSSLESKLFIALLRSQQPLYFEVDVLDINSLNHVLSDYRYQFSCVLCHPNCIVVSQCQNNFNYVTTTLLDENEVYILPIRDELGSLVLINDVSVNSALLDEVHVYRSTAYESIGVVMSNSFIKFRSHG